MKTLFFVFVTFYSGMSMACTCESSEETISRLLATSLKIEQNSLKISNVKTRINYLLSLPKLLASGSADEERACEANCSLRGVRITADVEYVMDDKVCSARFVKVSTREEAVKLKHVSCN